MANPAQVTCQQMTDEEIKQELENVGYSVEPLTPRRFLEEAYHAILKGKIDDSQAQTEKATSYYYQLYSKLFKETNGKRGCTVDTDPPVRIRFAHQDGDTELQFTYDGGNGFVKLDDKHVQPKPKFHLVSGQEYIVPYSVHEHLNSLWVRESKATAAPDGTVKTIPYIRQRVISSPVVSRQDVQRLQRKFPNKKGDDNA